MKIVEFFYLYTAKLLKDALSYGKQFRQSTLV